MVLVDTNIIIDLWKNRSDDIIQLFEPKLKFYKDGI